MPNDDLTIFMWWGVDATETEVYYWTHFQAAMYKAYDGNVEFVEGHTRDEYYRLQQHLFDNGWQLGGPNGSGAFTNMTREVWQNSRKNSSKLSRIFSILKRSNSKLVFHPKHIISGLNS